MPIRGFAQKIVPVRSVLELSDYFFSVEFLRILQWPRAESAGAVSGPLVLPPRCAPYCGCYNCVVYPVLLSGSCWTGRLSAQSNFAIGAQDLPHVPLTYAQLLHRCGGLVDQLPPRGCSVSVPRTTSKGAAAAPVCDDLRPSCLFATCGSCWGF